MELVSVIIPIYNKELYLRKTIECVLNQTYKDFELILINDGSTDKSEDVISDFQNLDPRIIYYYQDNKGVSVARNKGIELSKGKYVAFLDSDDMWNERFLEEMIDGIGKSDVCYCGHFFVEGEKRVKAKIKYIKGDIFEYYIKNICTPNTNSWLIKKNFITKNLFLFPEDVDWGEDMIFFSKLILNTHDVQCVEKCLTEYHLNNSNCLSDDSLKKVDKHIKWMKMLKKYIEHIEKDNIRKNKLLKAIDGYRLPSGIVYRILSNINNISVDELKECYEMNKKYFQKIRLNNGIRSFKLVTYLILMKLKIFIIMRNAND